MRYRFLLLCVLFLQTPFLFATGQSADVVRYEGKTWQLLARPISFDAILRRKCATVCLKIMAGQQPIGMDLRDIGQSKTTAFCSTVWFIS